MSGAPATNQQTPQITRMPPQSVEAEVCVLGAMILDAQSADVAVQLVRPDYFYRPAHQQIFTVLVDMSTAKQPVDLVSLREELTRRKLLDEVGGVSYLVALAEGVPNAANIEYYAKVVRDKALLRGLITATTDLCRDAYDSSEPAETILDHAEKRIFELTQSQVSNSAVPLRDLILETFERLEKLDGSLVTGLSTGYYQFDELTSGLQAGEMIIIAARPSMGKTAIALNMAEHMAVEDGKPVLVFSLEMSKQSLAMRFLSSRARFSASQMRRGMISPEDWTRLQMAADALEKAPLFIDDSAETTMLQIRARARRMKRQHDIQCIFIDYLQLITPAGNQESRQVQVSDISRQIKGLARELNVPVVTLSQLNRGPEDRIGHRPRMSDLRESGSIEQDADVVCLLHRPDYYEDDAEPNVAELIIAKQRNGPTDTVKLTFLRECTRFENYHSEASMA